MTWEKRIEVTRVELVTAGTPAKLRVEVIATLTLEGQVEVSEG